jgi:hypothetical protein
MSQATSSGGGGYQVSSDELAAGAAKITSLIEQASTAVAALQAVLSGLEDASPDQGLSSALGTTNTVAAGKLTDLVALYEHICSALTSTATSYQAVESQITSTLRAAGGE